jgi:molybdate/tungstate transport system substrate-binding protein
MHLKQRSLQRLTSLRLVPTSFCLVLLMSILLAACGGSTGTGSNSTPITAPKSKVSIAYAGSLVNLMEKKVGPAFTQATGYPYVGEGKGSSALANEIKGKLSFPDVFISAAPAVNTTLMGAANGNYVSWYAPFIRSSLVIGYSPNSKFAADFHAVASGSKAWYQVLEEPGIRIGRTDPALDPKGVRTIIMTELAEKYYNQPGLSTKILGAPNNTNQIFPEEELVTRLTSGQLDAGFFYLNEVTDANIPFVTLPTQINMSDPSLNSAYAKATYTDPKTGAVTKGSAIVYTITVLNTSKNKAGAIAFVQYIFSSQGESFFTNDGLSVVTPKISGDAAAVPPQLQSLFTL